MRTSDRSRRTARPDHLPDSYGISRDSGAASASAVTTFAYPILRALKLNARGRLEMLWPENFSKRSADLPEAYHDAGQFYWADARRFVQEKGLFFTDVVPMVLPRHLVVDIDTPEDWDLAERTYRLLHAGDDGEPSPDSRLLLLDFAPTTRNTQSGKRRKRRGDGSTARRPLLPSAERLLGPRRCSKDLNETET